MTNEEVEEAIADLAGRIHDLNPDLSEDEVRQMAATLHLNMNKVENGSDPNVLAKTLDPAVVAMWSQLSDQFRQETQQAQEQQHLADTGGGDPDVIVPDQRDEKEDAKHSFGRKIRTSNLHPDVAEEELKNFEKYWLEYQDTRGPTIFPIGPRFTGKVFTAQGFNAFFSSDKFDGIKRDSNDRAAFDQWVRVSAGDSLGMRDALNDTKDTLLTEAKSRGQTFFEFNQDPGFEGFFDQVVERGGGALARLKGIETERETAQRNAWEQYVTDTYIQPFLDRAATATEGQKEKFEARAAAVEAARDPLYDDYKASVASGNVANPAEYFSLKPDAGRYLSFDLPPPSGAGYSSLIAQRTAESGATQARADAALHDEFMKTLDADYLQELENKALLDPDNSALHLNHMNNLIRASEPLFASYMAFRASPGEVVGLEPDQQDVDTSIEAFFALPEVAPILTGQGAGGITAIAPLRLAQVNLLGAQVNLLGAQSTADTNASNKAFAEFFKATYIDPLDLQIRDEDDFDQRQRLVDRRNAIVGSGDSLSGEFSTSFKENGDTTPESFFRDRPDHDAVLRGETVENFIPSLGGVQIEIQTQNLLPEAQLQGKRDALTALHQFDPNFDLDAGLAAIDANPDIPLGQIHQQGRQTFEDEEEEQRKQAARNAQDQLEQFAGGAQVIEFDGRTHSVTAGDVFDRTGIEGIAGLFDPDNEQGFTLQGLQDRLIGPVGDVGAKTVGSLSGDRGLIASGIEQLGRNAGLDPNAAITDPAQLRDFGRSFTAHLFVGRKQRAQPGEPAPQPPPVPAKPPRLPRPRLAGW